MSQRRKGSGGGGEIAGAGAERWLLTYADMITLLLALFILLFAMSSIDAKKFDNVRRSLSDSFRGQPLEEQRSIVGGAPSPLDPSAANVTPAKSQIELMRQTQTEQATQAEREVTSVAQSLRASGLRVNDPNKGDVEVAVTERGVVVRLAGDTFFDSGSAAVKPGLAKALRGLGRDLRRDKRPFSIEGHTDGQPMLGGGLYAGNLELSTGRAETIYHLLVTLGIPATRMHVEGYGEVKPLVPPKFPHQSVPRNRRVEIIIMSSGSANSLPRTGADGQSSGGGAPLDLSQNAQLTPPQIIEPIRVISSQ